VSSEHHAGLDASDAAVTLLQAGELDAAIVGATAVQHDLRWPSSMRGDDEAVVCVIMSAARADDLGLPALCVWPPLRGGLSSGVSSPARHLVDDVASVRQLSHDSMSHETSLCLLTGVDAPAEPAPGFTQQRGAGSQRAALFARHDEELRSHWAEQRILRSNKTTITESSKWAYCYGPSTTSESSSLGVLLASVHADALRLPLTAQEVSDIHADGHRCVDNLGHATLRMQVLSRFLQHVAGVHVGAAVGVSLGESNMLLAHDVWRDWQSLRASTVASPLFGAALGEGQGVMTAALGEPHRVVVLSSSVSAVAAALAQHGGGRAWMTLIHHDQAVELGGAASAVAAVVKALGVIATELPHAPTVHNPHIAAVASDYHTLHHRMVHPSTMTMYSAGVGAQGGVLTQTSAAIADALLQQASRTVDVPALLRCAWADGIRGFIDVSPRGMMASWIRATLPDAVVIAVDDVDPLHGVLRACAQLHVAGLDIDIDHMVKVTRRVPHHRRPMATPARGVPVMPVVIAAATRSAEMMPPPPQLPAVLAPSSPPKSSPAVLSAPAPMPVVTRPTARGITTVAAAPTSTAQWVMNQRAHIDASHTAYLDHMAQAHAAYLKIQAAPSSTPVTKPTVVVTTTPITTSPPPQRSVPPITPASPVWLSREQLVSLATDPLSKVLGPAFAKQDVFPRQVRMPRPPLLLACRVLSTTATATRLEANHHIITQTDVRPDAWYLHEGRVPAGVLIETGQADLLLISYMGVDFDNRGARVYRLLGCDLSYTAHLPQVGDVLHHDIVIDGFANHGDTRIFFFHSDTRIGGPDGPICLQVRNGQAGFFSDEELANSGGVLWSAHEERADRVAAIKQLAHAPMPKFTSHRSLTRTQLEAFAEARPWDAFGDGFATTKTQVAPPRIDPPRQPQDPYGNPDGRFIDMLLLDRVTHLEPSGGPWSRGYLRAELDISPNKWFFDGHFQDDPCMPGTIMFQGCLQLASTFMAASGFTIARDGFRFEPKLGHAMPLRCRSQCTPSSQRLVYELFVQSISGSDDPTQPCELRADILVTVDGLKSLYAKDVIVALVPDAPMSAMPSLRGITAKLDGVDGVAPASVRHATGTQPITGFRSVMSTGIGVPSHAFPGLYEPFDGGRPVARMPGPPYYFMSRVDDVQGAMGSSARQQPAAGTHCRVAYDVPADAWYFHATKDTQGGAMPFAVLLEVALQPCGWLSSYVGSALTSSSSLSYRNLDGQGTQHRPVDATIGTLLTTATLRKSSSSGGMIIQEFSFAMTTSQGEPVFDGTTVFGFFPPEALANQVGLPVSDADRAGRAQPMKMIHCAPHTAGLPPLAAHPRAVSLRVVDDMAVGEGPMAVGQRVRSHKRVQLDDWFFRAHFFRDPVQPGSLGIEAMIQALSWWMHQAGLVPAGHHIESLATGSPLSWKYRGQVTPQQQDIEVELVITETTQLGPRVVVKADASLWVDGKKIYRADGLALASVPLSQLDP
jgi:3-hydroxymyristoyl/3-hydroxydecanoyl-(acyl carrier protein) dehydratase